MLIWGVLATYWRELEKSGTQSSLQEESEPTLTALTSDIHKGALSKYIFFQIIPISIKDNHSKIDLFAS